MSDFTSKLPIVTDMVDRTSDWGTAVETEEMTLKLGSMTNFLKMLFSGSWNIPRAGHLDRGCLL